MKTVAKLLEKHGIPGRDLYDLPTSALCFPDGADYRIEISGIERPEIFDMMVDAMKSEHVPIHRAICSVMGATLLTNDELHRMAVSAKKAGIEVILTPGPRASWDIGRQIATPEGALSGLRVRGSDQLNYLVTDILRAVKQGYRGFLVTDEGVLSLLNSMRAKGDLPKDTVFKISIYAGHANPAGARLLECLGANTFNPVADLNLAELAAIRRVIYIPMDIHVILSDSFGGFNRFYETPEIARVAAPCYFKIEPGTACASVGGMYRPWTDTKFLGNMAVEKVKYAGIIIDIIKNLNPTLIVSKQSPKDLAVPKPMR